MIFLLFAFMWNGNDVALAIKSEQKIFVLYSDPNANFANCINIIVLFYSQFLLKLIASRA